MQETKENISLDQTVEKEPEKAPFICRQKGQSQIDGVLSLIVEGRIFHPCLALLAKAPVTPPEKHQNGEINQNWRVNGKQRFSACIEGEKDTVGIRNEIA